VRPAALVALATAAVVGVTQAPAAAPSPVANAVAAQERLGYRPCHPSVAPLPLHLVAEGAAADADNGEQSGRCEIRLAWDLPDELLLEVVWHEVCHLSTGSAIANDPNRPSGDWAHEDYRFKRCVRQGPADTQGYGGTDEL